MKKLSLLVLAIVFSVQSFSQGLDFGIKAGINFSTISDAAGLDNKTGFVAGIFVGGKLNDKLGIQADLLYSQQGAEFNAGKFDLNYVNVPIVIKYFVTDKMHIHGGPQFGVLVDDKTQTVIGETINDIATNDFDISGVVGVGLDLPFGIRIDGRYSFGFTDVPNDPGKNFTKGKNSVITLSIGYSII
ncbi:MAG: porin family protein [Bacteroidetes bacterium]|nr:porin family protein [Bacteroidota bacterium]